MIRLDCLDSLLKVISIRFIENLALILGVNGVDFSFRIETMFVLFSSLQAWQSVVRIGAMNCYGGNNAPLCRQHNVRGYPTLLVRKKIF
mgnify:FL=1